MTIKEIRAKTGLTQRKFAELLGVSYWALIQWEQGRRQPPPYLIKLIDFYLEKKGVYQK